jgi:hypothetical protein
METIKKYMIENKLTVDDLAGMLKLHKATVYRHLCGQKFKLETAKKYALAMNVPLEQLLDHVA